MTASSKKIKIKKKQRKKGIISCEKRLTARGRVCVEEGGFNRIAFATEKRPNMWLELEQMNPR